MALFSKVLDKYGHLVGQWQLKITYYGGLVEVKMEDERLVGIEWQATNDNSPSLRRHDMFSIGLDRDGDIEILCLRGYGGPHQCRLRILSDSSFNLTCREYECHRHPAGDDEEFKELFQKVSGNLECGLEKDWIHMKFLEIKRYDDTFDFRRLQLPGPPEFKPVIQPGLFQGTYGGHGREIVALTYEQDGHLVKAIKISGDPNVPYGEVTFTADLRYPMVLGEGEQTTIEILTQVPPIPAAVPAQEVQVQPFMVPLGCVVGGHSNDLPNQCIARFSGNVQVAGHGHTNPYFIDGHWVIFNENLFALLCFKFPFIIVYQRVLTDV